MVKISIIVVILLAVGYYAFKTMKKWQNEDDDDHEEHFKEETENLTDLSKEVVTNSLEDLSKSEDIQEVDLTVGIQSEQPVKVEAAPFEEVPSNEDEKKEAFIVENLLETTRFNTIERVVKEFNIEYSEAIHLVSTTITKHKLVWNVGKMAYTKVNIVIDDVA